jgi:hypothetical protein
VEDFGDMAMNTELPNYEREHTTDSTECWCNPEVEALDDGSLLVIHHDPVEAAEEAQRILDESKPFDANES